jgi:hypothetical protein
MGYSILRAIVVLALFWGAGEYLQLPTILSIGAGLVVAGVLQFFAWYSRKTQVYTANELRGKPFGELVPPIVVESIDSAPALLGDESYSQKVVGTKAFAHGFEKVMHYAEVPDGSLVEVQSALIAEPANPNSSHAVAVAVGAVILGYIPEFESEALFSFLMNHRGVARVNTNIYLEVAYQESRVEIDLVRPFQIARGV